MRCDEARAALIDGRYAGTEPDAELVAHLAGCARCRDDQARQAALDRALSQLPSMPPAADFDARFFARLADERARARRKRVLVLGSALLPVAAALALAVLHASRPTPEHSPEAPAQPPQGAVEAVPASDMDLALDLDLVEDLDVVRNLDELEAYEVLQDVDDQELERALSEVSR